MNKVNEILTKIKSENVAVLGAGIGEQGYLLSKIDAPIFFVASDSENAYKISNQLTALNVKNVLLENFDSEFVISKFQSKDNQFKIINALSEILSGEVNVVVTTLNGYNFKLTSPKTFNDSILNFQLNSCYNLDETSKKLISLGYKRVETVEQVGEFSIRGDLLDIFACNQEYPVRINFFDDEIESIIFYDNVNLVRIKDLLSVKIVPNKLAIFTDEEIKSLKDNLNSNIKNYNDNVLMEYINNVENLPIELLELFGYKTYRIFDFLNNPIIVKQNLFTLNVKQEKYKDEINKRIDIVFKDENLKNDLKQINESNITFNDNSRNLIFENAQNYDINISTVELNCKKLNDYLKNIQLIKTDFNNLELKNKTINLCLDNEFTINSVKEVLFYNKIQFSSKPDAKGFVLTDNKIPYNICIEDEDVWFVGSTNFAHKKTFQTSKTKKVKFLPKNGEYVVHDVHGIGLCNGIVTLKVMGADKDFFKISYLKGDVLYVPTENTDSLSLYMGSENVKLNRLGGKEFAGIKARTEKAIEDMAKDLLVLYAKRASAKGYKYDDDNYLMTEFENAFEYTETADQMQAIEDIKQDMTSGKVMDRLICGDVGYGKTEVAMRAAFKTFLNNKQVAVLAPTTILSLQHYITFTKRMSEFGVKIEMLNRFKTPKEKAGIIKKLKNGEIDIICGTHSLLSDEIGFNDLGLLILDEEQRFGVKAKEKLKGLKNNVNVISMSATPIPRTLNMAMLTLRDISIINTPPKNRLAVKTYVVPFDIKLCAEYVEREIDRNGQVLIVYNDIEKIYGFTSRLKEIISDERCKFDVAHGKMAKNELENAIKRLYEKKTNVFVSTTLIENGVDLPSANTLIVLDSQTLGLSQMYQLRGRVGRSNEQAYAYFTYPQNKTITIEATDRLEALAENTELGSGFKIAMRDLQLRGAGELLGKEQHGNMIKVGYEMYVKLLEETTKRLKGESIEENKEVKIDIAITAKVPNDFASDETEKLKIYAKISNISDIESQKNIIAQLKDTYGKLPNEVLQLTNVSLIKSLAQKANVKHIIINKSNYSIVFYKENFDVNKTLNLLTKYNKFGLIKSELPTIKLNVNEFSPLTAQGYFIEFLNAQIALK